MTTNPEHSRGNNSQRLANTLNIDNIIINAEFSKGYLTHHSIILATAESCTAGTIVSMLSEIEGCGKFMDCGFVTYSSESKQRLLGVKPSTIDTYTLTSEEVAREMAVGALANSLATAAVATTGVAGPEPMDGIPPGVVCLAWSFRLDSRAEPAVYSGTVHLKGDRAQVRTEASTVAINGILHFHQQLLSTRQR